MYFLTVHQPVLLWASPYAGSGSQPAAESTPTANIPAAASFAASTDGIVVLVVHVVVLVVHVVVIVVHVVLIVVHVVVIVVHVVMFCVMLNKTTHFKY